MSWRVPVVTQDPVRTVDAGAPYPYRQIVVRGATSAQTLGPEAGKTWHIVNLYVETLSVAGASYFGLELLPEAGNTNVWSIASQSAAVGNRLYGSCRYGLSYYYYTDPSSNYQTGIPLPVPYLMSNQRLRITPVGVNVTMTVVLTVIEAPA